MDPKEKKFKNPKISIETRDLFSPTLFKANPSWYDSRVLEDLLYFHLQALPMAYTLETVQENYQTHQGLGLGNNVHFRLTEEVIR